MGVHTIATKKTNKKTDTRTFALLAHLLPFVCGWVAPLIIYLVATDKVAKEHAANAFNWQISLLIYLIISIPLLFVLVGFLFLMVLPILGLIFPIIAAVKANDGKVWKYPLSIPFLSV